ncbi:MAG: hypothetical protein [Arizlama microvirus]|nr:MAG: hypothetical protein [Arizlama microvirus]
MGESGRNGTCETEPQRAQNLSKQKAASVTRTSNERSEAKARSELTSQASCLKSFDKNFFKIKSYQL